MWFTSTDTFETEHYIHNPIYHVCLYILICIETVDGNRAKNNNVLMN